MYVKWAGLNSHIIGSIAEKISKYMYTPSCVYYTVISLRQSVYASAVLSCYTITKNACLNTIIYQSHRWVKKFSYFSKISISAHIHPILHMLYSIQYGSNYSHWSGMHSNSTDIHWDLGYPPKSSTLTFAASKKLLEYRTCLHWGASLVELWYDWFNSCSWWHTYSIITLCIDGWV